MKMEMKERGQYGSGYQVGEYFYILLVAGVCSGFRIQKLEGKGMEMFKGKTNSRPFPVHQFH